MAQTTLITGATSGIGEATAVRLAQDGHRLIICGRRAGRLELLKDRLVRLGSPDVVTLCFDIMNREEVGYAIDLLTGECRNIDVLINNAGLALGVSSIQEGEIDDWERMIDTNIKGLLYITRIIAPMMAERGRGHIINIGSIAGSQVYPGGNIYCATKHAVNALTQALRIDMLESGVRVSQVAPAATNTEFALVRYKGDRERAAKVYEGFYPLTGEDIAEVVAFIINRPEHVNISDILITPTAQATATMITRKKM